MYEYKVIILPLGITHMYKTKRTAVAHARKFNDDRNDIRRSFGLPDSKDRRAIIVCRRVEAWKEVNYDG